MLVILITVLVLIATILYVSKTPSGLPKGVKGWPLIGHIPHRRTHFIEQVEHFRQKYGNVFSWRMGSRNIVFLCNFQDIKEAFNNPYLSDRPDFHSLISFSYGKHIGIVSSNGESWQNIRRFTIKLLKDRGMGKSSYEPQIDQEVAYVIDDFKLHVNEIGDLPWSLNVAILNVTWRIVADCRYDIQDPTMQELQKTMRELIEGFQGYVQLMDYFPWLINITPKFVSKLLGIQNYYDSTNQAHNLIKKIIAEYKSQDDSEKQSNFIGSYLREMQKRDEGQHSDYASTFHEEDLIISLSDMFTAASETTSSAVRWTLHILAKYPEVQRKMQEEIDSVCSRQKRPSLEDKQNLPYTNAVIHEVMRCRPVAPFPFQHCASADTTIGDHKIPKGTIIIASAMHCHEDPQYWERPREFYPQHFLTPEGKFDGKKLSFIPFSIGRRVCIGESIAKRVVFLMVTALVQNFTFSAPHGKELSLALDTSQSFFSLPVDSVLTFRLRD